MKSVVFISRRANRLWQAVAIIGLWALTIQIDGDFDKAMDMVQEVCDRGAIYLLNSINPSQDRGAKNHHDRNAPPARMDRAGLGHCSRRNWEIPAPLARRLTNLNGAGLSTRFLK